MESRNIRGSTVAEFTVNLVTKQVEVVFLYQVANLVHLVAAIEVTCRVVRIADQNTFGFRGNHFLNLLDVWQVETFFNGRNYGFDGRSTGNCKCSIVGIGRFWNNNHESEVNSFRTTGSDNNVVGGNIDVELFVVFDQLLAKAQISITSRVRHKRKVDSFQIVDCRSGRSNVWLSDVQVIHFYTSCFCSVSKWHQFPDW